VAEEEVLSILNRGEHCPFGIAHVRYSQISVMAHHKVINKAHLKGINKAHPKAILSKAVTLNSRAAILLSSK
jgi:hypothetical protein